ncbi:MAG: hypothetical protein CMM41_11185 [Rhodospirillaceae bacterium]|nr:hypothetical protein [Rhodospirillaceae bacterium]MBC27759.1 hypothetical protein [Rhodospirillaceae bacterium]|tara:strand:+ start:178 stop:924 length:747 start_codon:yes stop_codon:yes gene_type:complete
MPVEQPWIIVGVAIAMLAGGFCKGASGISLALVSVSLAAIFVDISTAVALMTVPVLIANIWQVSSNAFVTETWREYKPLYIAILPGVAFGAKVLTSVDPTLISGIVGVLVVAFAFLIYNQPDWYLNPRTARRIRIPVGLTGGVIAGISGLVPPVLIYMVALKLPKERFICAVGIGYLTAVLALIFFLSSYKFFTLQLLFWSTVASIPMFVGQLVGQGVRRYMDDSLFRILILILMIFSGANLIRKAFY